MSASDVGYTITDARFVIELRRPGEFPPGLFLRVSLSRLRISLWRPAMICENVERAFERKLRSARMKGVKMGEIALIAGAVRDLFDHQRKHAMGDVDSPIVKG